MSCVLFLNKILNVVFRLFNVYFMFSKPLIFIASLLLYINSQNIQGFRTPSDNNTTQLSVLKKSSIKNNTRDYNYTHDFNIQNRSDLLYSLIPESYNYNIDSSHKNKIGFNYTDSDNNFYSISDLFSYIKDYYKSHNCYPFPFLTTVFGSVTSIRRIPSQNIIFIDLNDGSSIDNLQIVITNSNLYEHLGQIKAGDDLLAAGNVDYRKGKPSERSLSEFDLYISHADPNHKLKLHNHLNEDANPVLPNIDYSDEYLRKYPHLRFQNKRFESVIRIRSELMNFTFDFFSKNKFCYIETPSITRMNCENLHSFHLKSSQDNQLTDCSFLSPTGQMELEFACYALRRVWKFGPAFRSEVSDTTRHSSEFSMIEAEWFNASVEGMINFIEKYIQSSAQCILNNCKEYVQYLSKFDSEYEDHLKYLSSAKIKIITYDEAVTLLNKLLESDSDSKKYNYGPVTWGKRLTDSNEKALVDHFNNQLLAITNYPESISAFYMKKSTNKTNSHDSSNNTHYQLDVNQQNNLNVVENFDIIAPFGYEIAGGSLREDDYNTLKGKMEHLNMNEKGYQRYLDLRKYRYLPHGGFGIGFDRLVMLMTKKENIRDVKPFDNK